VTTPFDAFVEQFMTYLMARSGGGKNEKAAKTVKQNIVKFFRYIVHVHPQQKSESYKEILLNKKYLQEYLDYLEKNEVFSPSTMSGKINSLRSAIDFINFAENSDGMNHTLYSRCQVLTDTLKNWNKSLNKPKAAQRSIQRKESDLKVSRVYRVSIASNHVLKSIFDLWVK